MILHLYGDMRVRENPYFGLFYAVQFSDTIAFSQNLLNKKFNLKDKYHVNSILSDSDTVLLLVEKHMRTFLILKRYTANGRPNIID